MTSHAPKRWITLPNGDTEYAYIYESEDYGGIVAVYPVGSGSRSYWETAQPGTFRVMDP